MVLRRWKDELPLPALEMPQALREAQVVASCARGVQ